MVNPMPDNDRLDLNGDLDKLSGDLLKDVKAATEEVKLRKAADAEKDRRSATRDKDRRLSLIIIAVATIVLIMIAYWVVVARQPDGGAGTAYTRPKTAPPPITQPTVAPKRPPRPAPGGRANNQQDAPPNEYDQPGQ